MAIFDTKNFFFRFPSRSRAKKIFFVFHRGVAHREVTRLLDARLLNARLLDARLLDGKQFFSLDNGIKESRFDATP